MAEVSMRYGEMAEGGGLFEGVATVKDAEVILWDYGKGEVVRTFVHFTLADEEGEDHDGYWSAADPKDFKPLSEKGKEITREGVGGIGFSKCGERSNLINSTNFGQFVQELENAGFPGDQIGNDVRVFIGLEASWVRKAQPKRSGLFNQDPSRTPTILVVDRIISLPGEGGKKKGKKAEAGDSDGVSGKAEETIMGIISDNDEEIAASKLSGKIFSILKKDPDRRAVTKLAADEEWLSDKEERPWKFSDGVLSI